MRKEVEEEVYKSLVNKRLAAGEVTLKEEKNVMIMFILTMMISEKHCARIPFGSRL